MRQRLGSLPLVCVRKRSRTAFLGRDKCSHSIRSVTSRTLGQATHSAHLCPLWKLLASISLLSSLLLLLWLSRQGQTPGCNAMEISTATMLHCQSSPAKAPQGDLKEGQYSPLLPTEGSWGDSAPRQLSPKAVVHVHSGILLGHREEGQLILATARGTRRALC